VPIARFDIWLVISKRHLFFRCRKVKDLGRRVICTWHKLHRAAREREISDTWVTMGLKLVFLLHLHICIHDLSQFISRDYVFLPIRQSDCLYSLSVDWAGSFKLVTLWVPGQNFSLARASDQSITVFHPFYRKKGVLLLVQALCNKLWAGSLPVHFGLTQLLAILKFAVRLVRQDGVSITMQKSVSLFYQ